MSLVEAEVCFHCQRSLAGSTYRLAFHTVTEDVSLPLCPGCQSLRREGQLPVELILQQWLYANGQREDTGEPFRNVLVSLACLGCAAPLGALTAVAAGSAPLALADSRRLPDGSTAVPCPQCRRTNVLQSRGGQLVAVRLW
jgi:hypothetical protein